MNQTLNVSENTRVEIRACRNRVTIIGWDDPQISCDQPVRQDGNTIFVEGATKVNLRVPRAMPITLDDCRADVRAEDLTGELVLTNIRGDIALRNLRGETRIGDIDGSLVARRVTSLKGNGTWDGDVALHDLQTLSASNIDGDVVIRGANAVTLQDVEGSIVLERVECAQINTIEGDAHLNDVGAVTLQHVKNDLSARQLGGALSVADVEGDVNVREAHARVAIARVGGDFIVSDAHDALLTPEIEGDAVVSLSEVAETTVRADGDVVLNLPNETNAELRVDAPAGDIIVRADLQNRDEGANHLRGTLGRGGIALQIESRHGDVIVRSGSAAEHHYGHAHRQREEYREYAAAYRKMGQRLAEQVRASVRASLADAGIQPHRHKRHWRIGIGIDDSETLQEEPLANKPRGPASGSPERQAILDAIARGELNVDDAIKKLRGET